jgi:hypothetical protein
MYLVFSAFHEMHHMEMADILDQITSKGYDIQSRYSLNSLGQAICAVHMG